MSVNAVSKALGNPGYEPPRRRRCRTSITLIKDRGVLDEPHCLPKPKNTSNFSEMKALGNEDHRWKDFRQVHLIENELYQALGEYSDEIHHMYVPGDFDENITTKGVDFSKLMEGSKLYFADHPGVPPEQETFEHGAIVKVLMWRHPHTGVRFKSKHFEALSVLTTRMTTETGEEVVDSRLGVFGVVVRGGMVTEGMAIRVKHPHNGLPLC